MFQRLAIRLLWGMSRKPQRQLACRLGLKLNEVGERTSQLATIDVGSALDFRRELVGNVPRPAFGRVEGDDAQEAAAAASSYSRYITGSDCSWRRCGHRGS